MAEKCSYCGEEGHSIQNCPKWKGKEVATATREEQVFEDVNAIEFFPTGHFVDVYVKGKQHRIEHVIAVEWLPYMHPKPEEKLPVTLFKTNSLSTSIHFSPYVKARYNPINMEITILWSLTASSSSSSPKRVYVSPAELIPVPKEAVAMAEKRPPQQFTVIMNKGLSTEMTVDVIATTEPEASFLARDKFYAQYTLLPQTLEIKLKK